MGLIRGDSVLFRGAEYVVLRVVTGGEFVLIYIPGERHSSIPNVPVSELRRL